MFGKWASKAIQAVGGLNQTASCVQPLLPRRRSRWPWSNNRRTGVTLYGCLAALQMQQLQRVAASHAPRMGRRRRPPGRDALRTEGERAVLYATLEALLQHPELQAFVAWVKTPA